MKLRLLVFPLFLLLCGGVSESAKILGIFPNAGYSQYILGSSLMKQLADKGHQVTIISPFSLKNKVENIKEICTTNLSEPSYDPGLYDLEASNAFINIMTTYALGFKITEQVFANPEVKSLLESEETFDLVILEQFLNEAHMIFGHHFKAPVVLFSSLGATEWTNHLVGNPAPYSYIPLMYSGYTTHMDFSQRLRNTILSIFDTFYKELIVFPTQRKILTRYFPDAPDLSSLMYNASIVLLNSDISINEPVPHVPSMIDVGGFHVQPHGKLPLELKKVLDEARNGVIVFSMGSNLRSSDLSEVQMRDILKVFAKLKQLVIWKWESGDLPGKPSNVMTMQWLPQQEVLGHPNVKAFISHGGLLSTTESVYHGVPIVGIPIFGDQKMNIAKAVKQGYAVLLPFQDLNEKSLEEALNNILYNPKYYETAQAKSKIMRDQPIKPMEKAIFWIEYVLRHGPCYHLRTAALKLSWHEYFLLDVLSILFVPASTVAAFIALILQRRFWNSAKKEANIKKKNK